MADRGSDMQQFYRELSSLNAAPLWEVLNNLVPEAPTPKGAAFKWEYAALRAALMKSGELITAEEAERRVLILESPGFAGAAAITGSLYAGLQLVLPGEIAPCHRHAQAALRFVMEGAGGHTAVNGEKIVMRPYDLILTPPGAWHDHGNDSDDPIIWLDGLDIPLIETLECGYAERYLEPTFPTGGAPGATILQHGSNMRPAYADSKQTAGDETILCHYPYEKWRAVMEGLKSAGRPDPHTAYSMEFMNPTTGGPVLPTISAFAHLVPAGFETRSYRSTDGGACVVCAGDGAVRIGDAESELAERDIFTIPAWAEVKFRAQNDLLVFRYSNRASQTAVNSWRERRC